MTYELTRRAALSGGVSIVALAGVPAVAAVNADAETLNLARTVIERFQAMERLVDDLRGISRQTPACAYHAVQAVANRIELEIFGRNPEPLPEYVTRRGYGGTNSQLYVDLFKKIGGVS